MGIIPSSPSSNQKPQEAAEEPQEVTCVSVSIILDNPELEAAAEPETETSNAIETSPNPTFVRLDQEVALDIRVLVPDAERVDVAPGTGDSELEYEPEIELEYNPTEIDSDTDTEIHQTESTVGCEHAVLRRHHGQ